MTGVRVGATIRITINVNLQKIILRERTMKETEGVKENTKRFDL